MKSLQADLTQPIKKQMSKIDSFFRVIQRFNSLIPALALIFITATSIWLLFFEGKHNNQKSVAAPSTPTIDRTETYKIRGTHLQARDGQLMFKLTALPSTRLDYEGEETRNILFLTTKTGEARWLYPDQRQAISTIEQAPDDSDLEHILYIVSRLANLTKQERNEAQSTLSLAKQDGSELTNIISEIDEILERKWENGRLKVIYQKSDELKVAEINLKDFKVDIDITIINLKKVR